MVYGFRKHVHYIQAIMYFNIQKITFMKRYVRFDRTRFFDVDFDWTSRLGLRILYDRAYLLKVK